MADVRRTDIVALIFDFDDTLLPDSTTKLLTDHGIDADVFWKKEVAALTSQGYDPPIGWLNLLLKNVGRDRPLGDLTNLRLREFGKSLDGSFYSGIPEFFDSLTAVAKETPNVEIEFYIVSSGLYEVIKGSPIVQKYFKGVYACHLGGDTSDGVLKYIKRSITFTEKTRYIFEINKGLEPRQTSKVPTLVNKFVSADDRRIPLRNMIYVGDGLTDIPCFSLLKKNGGYGFGVFDPQSPAKSKQALEEFLKPDRVISMHAPNYRKDSELGALLRAAVAARCTEINLERSQLRR